MITQEQKLINQLKQEWQNTNTLNYDVLERSLKVLNKIVSNNPEYTALADTLSIISYAYAEWKNNRPGDVTKLNQGEHDERK